jgi:hypothetical protein
VSQIMTSKSTKHLQFLTDWAITVCDKLRLEKHSEKNVIDF